MEIRGEARPGRRRRSGGDNDGDSDDTDKQKPTGKGGTNERQAKKGAGGSWLFVGVPGGGCGLTFVERAGNLEGAAGAANVDRGVLEIRRPVVGRELRWQWKVDFGGDCLGFVRWTGQLREWIQLIDLKLGAGAEQVARAA